MLAERSRALHGNNFVLPVAVAIVRLNQDVVKVPEIRNELRGFVPENRIREGLERLCAMQVVTELPHAGRPSPRLFERRSSAYWGFVVQYAREHLSDSDVPGNPFGALK